jgi:hypothetical protein
VLAWFLISKDLGKFENKKVRILKSTMKGLFLNIIIKSQQEPPSCSLILIFTVRTKDIVNLFMMILVNRFLAYTYDNFLFHQKFKLIIFCTIKSEIEQLNLKINKFFLTWFKVPMKLIPINLKWSIAMICYNKLAYYNVSLIGGKLLLTRRWWLSNRNCRRREQ